MANTPVQPPRLQRSTMLTAPSEAAVSVRKACNGIKRMSAITVAAMVGGVDAKEAVAASHDMAMGVLKSIGFDLEDKARVDAVLPMVLEATTTVVADAALHCKTGMFETSALEKAASFGAVTMSTVARSRTVARMIESGWSADIDATTALRVTAATAMAQIAVELAEFDFMHPPTECIKEASRVVVKAAVDAARDLAPAGATAPARLMLTQSLIQSGARVYAACLRVAAADQTAQLDALSDAACEERLKALEKEPVSQVLAPVARRFMEAFTGIREVSATIIAGAETPATPAAPGSRRPIPGARAPRVR